MKPMVKISTPLLSYSDITLKGSDLFEDAFGLNSEFSDVIGILKKLHPSPRKKLTRQLIEKARKSN